MSKCSRCSGRGYLVRGVNCTRCGGTGYTATSTELILSDILEDTTTQRQTTDNLRAERERKYKTVIDHLAQLDSSLESERHARQAGDSTVGDAISETQRKLRAELDSLRTQIALTRKVEITLKQTPEDPGTVLDSTQNFHPKFETLLKIATSRDSAGFAPNIWISGPAGSGKTSGARQLAKALNRPFFYNGALSTEFQLMGYRDAAGVYHSTAFIDALSQPSVYLFDDIDSCDSNQPLLAMNGATANGIVSYPGGQLERHKDCIIICTANTWGLGATADYVGRVKIDAAFLSRFPARLHWDYDETFEQTICGNPDWAKRVQAVRKLAAERGLKVVIDPRASIAGAALLATGFSLREAEDLTYLANLSPDQKSALSLNDLDDLLSQTRPNAVASDFPCADTAKTLISALASYREIEAIRAYRDLTGVGLREAKRAIESVKV